MIEILWSVTIHLGLGIRGREEHGVNRNNFLGWIIGSIFAISISQHRIFVKFTRDYGAWVSQFRDVICEICAISLAIPSSPLPVDHGNLMKSLLTASLKPPDERVLSRCLERQRRNRSISAIFRILSQSFQRCANVPCPENLFFTVTWKVFVQQSKLHIWLTFALLI